MKKYLVILCAALALALNADTWTDPDTRTTWTYQISNGEACVQSDKAGQAAISGRMPCEAIVPSELGGCPVTSIGDSAFIGCGRHSSVIGEDPGCGLVGISSVKIPQGVTNIGARAFSGCDGLYSVSIPPSVINIGESAFQGCSSLEMVTIPSSVIDIGDYAFYGCNSLSLVMIPSSVSSVGRSMFEECSALIKVSIPSSITNIGNQAFCRCTSLTSVKIPSSVMTIGGYAFSGCSALTSLTISSGVTSISWDAFSGCSSLASVTIPSSVTRVGEGSFSGCSSLVSFTVDKANPNYASINGLLCSKDGAELIAGINGNVTIPPSVKRVGNYAFCGCSNLVSVKIPLSVTSISRDAFEGCSSLTSVTIPSSVTNIGDYAFFGCSSLTSATIPSSITSIGEGVFGECCSLPSVTIPSSVTSIGERAFDGCGLIMVTIPSSVTSIGDSAFGWCTKLTSVTLKKGLIFIGDGAFKCCDSLASVTIPSSVTSIGNRTFAYCSSLTSVSIPSSVASVGEGVFENIRNHLTIYIDSGDGIRLRNLMQDVGVDVRRYDFVERGSVPSVPSSEGAFDALLANNFDGIIVDDACEFHGVISVKVAKATGKKTSGALKTTVTIQMAGESKKISVKGSISSQDGKLIAVASGGRNLRLEMTQNGLSGSFGRFSVVGARNLLASTAKGDKGTEAKIAADAVLSRFKGNYILAYADHSGYNGLSFAIGTKGVVKVSGTLSNGSKVLVSTQLIIGDNESYIPVVYTKKGVSIAFCICLANDGSNVNVAELNDFAFSVVGGLSAGCSFALDESIVDLFKGYQLLDEFLPCAVLVEPKGSKWIVADGAKAGKIKVKDGIAIDTVGAGNPSGLKMTFTAKTGAFKGSFKVYALDAKGKLKTFSAAITGFVVGGCGYGVATIKGRGRCTILIGK